MTEENKKLFYDYVNEARKRELSNSQWYDKVVLTLSSASLGFSLSLIELENSKYLTLIFISWVLLTITITFILLSFIFANKELNKSIESAERYYLRGDESALNENEKNGFNSTRLNYASATFLVISIVMIVIFKISNS